MNSTSTRLTKSIPQIMAAWEERALVEVKSAHHQESLALRNSLPEYLTQMADALSKKIDRTQARNRLDREESTRIGKKHGSERAASFNYTMDQMILEYHILRQVLFDIMEEEKDLTSTEREVMICSIEQAVNDAATQFSDSLKDYQDHLSHTLVHDLRNPLTVAKASSELILRNKDTSEYCADKTKKVITNLNRIDMMITELLDASRKEAWENISLDFHDCDLDLILKEIIEESAMAHGDRFKYESNGMCIGEWNENSLRRLIENLTTNAVKYGLENTPITFKLSSDHNSAIFAIHNEGTPIPTEEQSLLFDKFRRSESAKRKEGWGLGLNVVKGMVESHSGSIEISSGPDIGTTFIITLPTTSIKKTDEVHMEEEAGYMPKISMDKSDKNESRLN
jgi:signal transduction histidine kinase